MKKASKNTILGTIAFLCLSLGGSVQAQVKNAQEKDAPEKDTGFQMIIYPRQGLPPAVTKINKATGFVGMQVRNQFGERLGKVKDLVFDLESERVAYVVLLPEGSGVHDDKLLAVSLNAFTASEDQKYLILRAEKWRMQSAVGFQQNDWPRVMNPAWGAQPFWREVPGRSGSEKKELPAPGIEKQKEEQTPKEPNDQN